MLNSGINTKKQIQGAAKELRKGSLLLSVHYDDLNVVRSIARKILHISSDLKLSGKHRETGRELLLVACDLMVAAKLLATAHDPRLGKKKSAAARKLISIARELQAPRNLVAVARRLEKAGSQPLKKLGAKSRT